MPNRLLIEPRLRPISGDRFQPTGFPDIGAAIYDRPIGTDGDRAWESCLLVESAQSMANHLEATAWDLGAQEPVGAFTGLPYIRVVDKNGNYLTSSRREAHRLASAFVKDAKLDGVGMRDVIRDRLGLRDDTPLAPRDIAGAIFKIDPMCLIHGVFFAESAKVWPGQPKITRALTSFVEARDVRPVISGGVKRDDVRHSIGEGAGGAAEGYGFVPFHRTEYVAHEIVSSFVLDLDQLSSYGLGAPATELLEVAARWEIRSLLDKGFRPRTACDLVLDDPSRVDEELGMLDSLTGRLASLVRECGDLLDGGAPLDVVWDAKNAKKKGKAANSDASDDEEGED